MSTLPAGATPATKTRIEYDDTPVRQFMVASIVWGIVGMLVGVLIATQLGVWQANFKTSWLTFGRLRPLHTNAVIFAFVGNMMFAGVYYSTQRLVKARTASKLLSPFHFWGWQLIIVAAAITLPLGLTRGKEYAELIWPINIAVAVIRVVFAINVFWTLARRNEPSLYVAIWFYIATIITVAMLYIVNHLSIPTSWTHSYPIFGGVQDALVQWWYGHNAVAFFLTTPILGIMYYFLPKAAERPVYRSRLSVVHFWSLVFIYIWAGPYHLLNTSLPVWLQSLGMVFSLMLWAPSWGGMLNGLLTLRGTWNKLRTDSVLKFFAAGVTFFGMATFEGPLMSIKSVNALSHYSDWTIAHVHCGALGWNGFMAAGMFYWFGTVGSAQINQRIIERTRILRSLSDAVSYLQRHHSTRAILAVVMVLGWFTATNHCALGLMQKSLLAKAEHSKCCSGNAAPAKDGQKPDGARECCKSIQASPMLEAKVLAKYGTSHFVVQVFALVTVMGDEAAALDAQAALCEYGPPRAASFAELVLHRSLRSHAPPFLA